MKAQPKPGDPVTIRLFDARLVTGNICVGGITDTVAGEKIRVRSGHAVYVVNPNQIISTKSEAE